MTAKTVKKARPDTVFDWSWGAALTGPVWAVVHGVRWGLVGLLPLVGITGYALADFCGKRAPDFLLPCSLFGGLIFTALMGILGRRQAWTAGTWRQEAEMLASERRWLLGGVLAWTIGFGVFCTGIFLFVFSEASAFGSH